MDSGPRGEICTSCQNGCEQARASICSNLIAQRMMDDVWKWHNKRSAPQRKWNTHSSFLHHINIMIHFSFVTVPPCGKKKWCNPFSNRHGWHQMEPKISSAEKKRKVTNPRKGRPQVHILEEDLGYMALLSSFNLIFHRIHGIGIFIYINHEHQLNV